MERWNTCVDPKQIMIEKLQIHENAIQYKLRDPFHEMAQHTDKNTLIKHMKTHVNIPIRLNLNK